MNLVAALLAFVLALSGILTPSVEASASAGGSCAARPARRACCCEPSRAECSCGTAPAPTRPQPLEGTQSSPSSARTSLALAGSAPAAAPRALATAAATPALVPAHATAGSRLHLLVGVFRE